MPRGRPPKPHALHAINGNPGRRRRDPPPVVSRDVPPPRPGLSEEILAERQRILGAAAHLETLNASHGPSLDAGASVAAKLWEVEADIRAHGWTYESVTAEGHVMHRPRPEVAIFLELHRLHRNFLSDHGLTWTTGLKASPRDANRDPIEDFLTSRGAAAS